MKNQSLKCAYVLDRQGGGKTVDWDEINSWESEKGILWLHMDYSIDETEKWLKEESHLDEFVTSGLLSEQTRPRCTVMKDGVLVMLRAINFNPGDEPEDMISIRMWINENLIITTNRRKLLSVEEMVKSIESGDGPRTSGEFLAEITHRISELMSDNVNEIDDKADELENLVLNEQNYYLKSEISELRRSAISLRRYLIPQREALERLSNQRMAWLNDSNRLQILESSDKTMRYIENLDAVREKAIVFQEELMSHISEQMNKRMYLLSLIAAIFLPLGFFTGLLGINVGGIPGADNTYAFWFFCFLLISMVLIQIYLFKKLKWI